MPFLEPTPNGQRRPLSQSLPVQACSHLPVASPRDISGYNFLFIAQSFPYLLLVEIHQDFWSVDGMLFPTSNVSRDCNYCEFILISLVS